MPEDESGGDETNVAETAPVLWEPPKPTLRGALGHLVGAVLFALLFVATVGLAFRMFGDTSYHWRAFKSEARRWLLDA